MRMMLAMHGMTLGEACARDVGLGVILSSLSTAYAGDVRLRVTLSAVDARDVGLGVILSTANASDIRFGVVLI